MLKQLISLMLLGLLIFSGCDLDSNNDKSDTPAVTDQTGPTDSTDTTNQTDTTDQTGTTTHTLSLSTSNGAISGPTAPCTGTCNYDYDAGTQLTLTAIADQGYEFTGWSGACSGNGSCQVTIDQDLTISAIFTEVQLPPAKFSVEVSWKAPTEREDQSQLAVSEIDHYEVVYTRLDDNTSETVMVDDPTANSIIINDLPEGDYEFYAQTVDTNELHSRSSETVLITLSN